ncbi:MAG: hypothetical protein ACYCTE_08630 [Acidimicrobiales bacterium]
MGVPPEVALGAVRFSLGHDNDQAAVAAAVDILVMAHEEAIRLSRGQAKSLTEQPLDQQSCRRLEFR